MEKKREFTIEELAEFDGKEGSPVYVAFGGTVYDVTNSSLWKEGVHQHRHLAGIDLTEQLGIAPHGAEVFDRPGIEAVGTLKGDQAGSEIPAFLGYLFRKFPPLRRHTHPATVHFPIAYLIAGMLFTVIHLILPGLFGINHEGIAFAMLILATIFTPVTVLTGFGTWWVNYNLRWSTRIGRLIVLSVVLMFSELACIVLRISGPVNQGGTGLIYYGLMLLMGPLVIIIAYNGGQLVFPTRRD